MVTDGGRLAPRGTARPWSGTAREGYKRAYAYYKKLRTTIPRALFLDRADERVSYIERHYFDIR